MIEIDSDLLTDEQAAEVLGLEPRTVRAWRTSKGLPFIRVSSKFVRIRRGDLNTWLSRQRVAQRTIPQ